MSPASIQISGESSSAAEVQDICESSREDGGVQSLSVRGCQLSDRDFGRVCRGVAESRCSAQLNSNSGVVSSIGRARHSADASRTNRSSQSSFLHGSPSSDAGSVASNAASSTHPSSVCSDSGDCMSGEEASASICGSSPPDGAKSGLRESTSSANPRIGTKGWARFAVAVAHSSQLRVSNSDYNPSGDQIAAMSAVAVASSRTSEVSDSEGTGSTNQSAQVFSDMVENYPTSSRVSVSAENDISPESQQQISDSSSEGEEEEGREAPPLSPCHAHSSASQPIREKHQPLTWLPHSSKG